jgi:hypothetical protein
LPYIFSRWHWWIFRGRNDREGTLNGFRRVPFNEPIMTVTIIFRLSLSRSHTQSLSIPEIEICIFEQVSWLISLSQHEVVRIRQRYIFSLDVIFIWIAFSYFHLRVWETRPQRS